MKTPEEIKRGLDYLSIKDITQKMDMWKEGIAYDYAEDAAADALAYIQKLEQEKELLIEQLHGYCFACKHHGKPFYEFPCNDCADSSNDVDNWEWHGVEEEAE